MNQKRLLLVSLLGLSLLLSGCWGKKNQESPTPSPAAATQTAPPTAVFTATPVASNLLRDVIGEKIIVATSADFPPYESLDGQNNVVRFDIDLIREIGQRGGVQVEVQNVGSMSALLPALDSGAAHVVIAGIRPTAERRKLMDFTQFYHLLPQTVVTAPDLPITVGSIAEISKYSLGVTKDTPLDQWIIYDQVQSGAVPLANLNRYDTEMELIQALKADKILIGLMDSQTALDHSNNGEIKILLTAQIIPDGQAIAVKKGQTALLNALDQILTTLQGEGVIARLEATYFRH